MTATVASFRQALPEFADGSVFPNFQVEFWLAVAAKLVNSSRWGTLTDTGIYLFTAHNITLEQRAARTAANGGIPGETPGIVNNKSVDKVSVGYDTSAGSETEAGHWNLTIYGTRFIRMSRMMGAGGIQLGAGGCSGDGALAWAGPWTANFPNPSG